MFALQWKNFDELNSNGSLQSLTLMDLSSVKEIDLYLYDVPAYGSKEDVLFGVAYYAVDTLNYDAFRNVAYLSKTRFILDEESDFLTGRCTSIKGVFDQIKQKDTALWEDVDINKIYNNVQIPHQRFYGWDGRTLQTFSEVDAYLYYRNNAIESGIDRVKTEYDIASLLETFKNISENQRNFRTSDDFMAEFVKRTTDEQRSAFKRLQGTHYKEKVVGQVSSEHLGKFGITREPYTPYDMENETKYLEARKRYKKIPFKNRPHTYKEYYNKVAKAFGAENATHYGHQLAQFDSAEWSNPLRIVTAIELYNERIEAKPKISSNIPF